MMASFSNLLDWLVGKDVRNEFRSNLEGRHNTPSIAHHFLFPVMDPTYFQGPDTLWVVDRILEQQSVGQYITAAMGQKPLPDGEMIDQPLDPDDIIMITHSISSWAPPPYDTEPLVPTDKMMILIGSDDDASRLQIISKELQAMKARLWEGIMPLSARRWRERELYDLANFSAASRILSMAVNVFLYLNHPAVKQALRETVNLIDETLHVFEGALNAKRATEDKPPAEVCKAWHKFIRARYALMVDRTHGWVMNHVHHLKRKILDRLDELQSPDSSLEPDTAEAERMKLYDMWQDISEITSQADYAILLPTDGYNGFESDVPRPEYDFRNEPLRAHPDIHQRNLDYHNRRGHLAMALMFQDLMSQQRDNSTLRLLQQQDAGQQLVRAELRGEPVSYEVEPWVRMVDEDEDWGFVAYRTYHSCSDAEWQEFRAKFDADIADWGSELAGVEQLRERSKIHWIDVKDLGIDGEDIEALKSSFRSFAETPDFPTGFATDMFLMADEPSVSSYLKPQPESSPPGDSTGFICVVDPDHDPVKGTERPDESPGYEGTLRVLGSLLWDDLSALVASHSQCLDTLWPLAMNHPTRVYTGPVEKIGSRPGTI